MTTRRYEQKVREKGITEDILRERRALQDKKFYDILFEGLKFDGPVSVFNIGCGMGGIIDYLPGRGIAISEYLGIDLVAEFIDSCQYKYKYKYPHFEFLRGNFIMEKFQPKKKYDLVVCLGMLVTRTRDYEEYIEYMAGKMADLSQGYVLFNIMTDISPGSKNYPHKNEVGGTTFINEKNLIKILDRIKSRTPMDYAIRKESIYPDATDAFIRIKI